MSPPSNSPGPTPDLTRRQALRLLLAALVTGVGACSSRPAQRAAPPPKRLIGPSSTTSTSSSASASTTTSAPATTTTTAEPAPTTTVTEPAPTTTQPAPPPAQPAPPTGPHPSGAVAGFVAFGDFGGGPAQGAVAQAMTRWSSEHRVDALVTTGDNVYSYGEPHLFAAYLDEPYRELRSTRPMWVTLGNHDVMRGHGPAQLAHLGLPPLPYATTLAGVRLFFLDSSRDLAAQAEWLDQQLAQPGPSCSVVVFHTPVYSCGLHGPHPPVVDVWAPVIERHRVNLVLNGHDHLYHRFLSPGGVTYVVTGGGGYDLYAHTPGCSPPELQASAVRHHFTGVEVFADHLVISAVGTDGLVFDRAEIPLPSRVGTPAG